MGVPEAVCAVRRATDDKGKGGATASRGEGGACWICLEEATTQDPLFAPCKCPSRFTHRKCLATWQLNSAGKQEEKNCRFCFTELPGWKDTLTPQHLRPQMDQGQALMAVVFKGKVHKVPVSNGPDGEREFRKKIQSLFNLPDTHKFEVTFECRTPTTGERVQLKGFRTYDAATHLASITAARRHVGPSKTAGAAPTPSKGAGAAPTASPPVPRARATSLPVAAAVSRAAAAGASSSSAAGSAQPSPRPPSVAQPSPRPASFAQRSAASVPLPAASNVAGAAAAAAAASAASAAAVVAAGGSDVILTPRRTAALQRDQQPRPISPFSPPKSRNLLGYMKKGLRWLQKEL